MVYFSISSASTSSKSTSSILRALLCTPAPIGHEVKLEKWWGFFEWNRSKGIIERFAGFLMSIVGRRRNSSGKYSRSFSLATACVQSFLVYLRSVLSCVVLCVRPNPSLTFLSLASFPFKDTRGHQSHLLIQSFPSCPFSPNTTSSRNDIFVKPDLRTSLFLSYSLDP